MPSPWATQEDSESLWYEQSSYASTHIASIGYGVHAAIFSTVIYYTIQQRKSQRAEVFISQILFNGLLFVLGTINLACSIQFNENAWINLREYPRGAIGYLFEQQAAPILTLGNCTTIIISIMADGLLLYRVILLWNYRWYIIVFNTIFYIVTVLLSILTVVQIALPNANMLPLSLAVWLILMIINILFTLQIAGRIWFHRKRVLAALGPEQAKMYTGIAAIVVESALPFTIPSVVLLGLFGDSNTAQNLFVSLLVQLECIGPELIMLRVVLGRAWTQNTLQREKGTQLSTMQFGSDPAQGKVETTSESGDNSSSREHDPDV